MKNFFEQILFDSVREMSERFANGTPFPHLVIDNFFSKEGIEFVKQNFPDEGADIWKTPSNKVTINKSVTRRGTNDLKTDLFTKEQLGITNQTTNPT